MLLRKRVTIKFCLRYGSLLVICLFLLEYAGLIAFLFEESFSENFRYPYDGDVSRQCRMIRNGQEPEVEPINNQTYSYRHQSETCSGIAGVSPYLMIIVKSKFDHFDRRNAIRSSWGQDGRFQGVLIKTVFTLGIDQKFHDGKSLEVQKLIDHEAETHGDINQFNFIDAYFNNTIKTMNGIRWSKENCANSSFFLFVDDDFYVSTKNILNYIRDPKNYPDQVERSSKELTNDENFFAGFVFKTAPHRRRNSKWFIPLSEYKYDMWPDYVTAGVFLMSQNTLQTMHCVSLYTKHFRFDDIYLGLVALKAKITPRHSKEFYFYKAAYRGPESYRHVLATHGYEDPKEMLRVWTETKKEGLA